MLVIRVELHPCGRGGDNVTELARMVVTNVGGTDEFGDYEVSAAEGFVGRFGIWNAPSTADVLGTAKLRGHVINYARLAEPVWSLVAKALAAIGFRDE